MRYVRGYRTTLVGCFFGLRLLINYYRHAFRRKSLRKSFHFPGIDFDHYQHHRRVEGTLIFVHGMAKLGKDDPRVVQLAESIARTGYRVIVPDFPSIRSLEIYKGQEDEVFSRLELLCEDKKFVSDKFFLMAVSFSSVFAFHAACHTRLAKRIAGLCLIGGYFNIDTVLSFITQSNRSDVYGRLLILKNYYKQLMPEKIEHQSILERCLLENDKEDRSWNPDVSLDQSNFVEYEIYCALTKDDVREIIVDNVRGVVEQAWSEYKLRMDSFQSNVPVLLIHGRNDRIIPSGESKRLMRQLVERKVPVYLCVTDYLDHANGVFHPSLCGELLHLLRGFAWLLR